jgi:hypothetical protein
MGITSSPAQLDRAGYGMRRNYNTNQAMGTSAKSMELGRSTPFGRFFKLRTPEPEIDLG